MAQKPDYYAALGVAKTATADEIKKAHRAIAMSSHPDRVKLNANLNPQQKEAAIARYKFATEAYEILSDSAKRSIYDKYGHKGIEDHQAANKGGASPRPASTTTVMKPSDIPNEDAFDFFARRAKEREASGGNTESREQRLARIRQDRNGGSAQPAAPSTGAASSVSIDFSAAAGKLKETTDKLRAAAGQSFPRDPLQNLKQRLEDCLKEVNTAIAKSKPGISL